ncbi:hypothetical protein E1A91_A05G073400v1 [Gossypium mustelinum]|uniref:Uncharacterized protein n=1 Tax=Gossypium mustelinum TaxID=34275 RepID=A0A5D2Z463_GOSMU|nr:hypothetical protein E1A91_A05G073400v1 [Gossypium mustelinum]
MVTPHYLLLHSKHPSPFPPLTLSKTKRSLISQLTELKHQYVEKDRERYEVDPEKAKEALQKLDQQLQTLSNKPVSTPKIRASDVKLTRDEMVEDSPEISGYFLTSLTTALLIFTIFYNVLFYFVIKPSIDGPDSPPPQPTTSFTEPRVLE